MVNPKAQSLNLVPAIREIEKTISSIDYEYTQKLAPYKKSLEELRKVNTACEKCGGSGRILRSRACAEDDRPDPNDPRDYNTCDKCKGTGLAHLS